MTFRVMNIAKWELILGAIFIPLFFIVVLILFTSISWILIPFLFLIIWQLNLVFAEITLNDNGIIYQSWLKEIFISWNSVQTLGGIRRIKRKYFEVISLAQLKANIEYESQLNYIEFQGEVRKFVFLSSKKAFDPNRFIWTNEHYINFEYRSEALKFIQEKLEAINKNV